MKTFCKNHPDRVAKKKCYYCRQPICTQCQILAAHHFYCSQRCYRLNRIKNFRIAAIEYSKRLLLTWLKEVKHFLQILRTPSKIPFRLIFDIILVWGLVVSLTFSFNLSRKLTRLEEKFLPLEKDKDSEKVNITESSKMIDSLSILAPRPEAMVLSNLIDIEGEAGDNKIISLSIDGRVIQATLSEGGRFSFKGIKAKRGRNEFVVRAISEDGSVATLEKINIFYSSPTLRYLAQDFVRGNLMEKKVALTFDGGSTDNAAAEILDMLKAKGVKSTFFLTGQFILRFPETVKRIVAEGHEVGNHTWDHPHLTTYIENGQHYTRPGVTRELVQQQLLKTAELFKSVTGKEMLPLWRAPYGEHNYQIRTWAAELGYRQVGWTMGKNLEESMDTLDWVADKSSVHYFSADEIVTKILNFGNNHKDGANGGIILMHLGTERSDDQPHKRLSEIIDGFREKGYQWVPVFNLLE